MKKNRFWNWTLLKVSTVLVIYPLFFIVMPWMSAISRDQALLKGYAVPPEWEVVTVNHGQVLQCKMGLIKDHPMKFSAYLAALLIALGVFFWGVVDIYYQNRSKQQKLIDA